MALVVARLQYALPALAGQLSADDLNKVDVVLTQVFMALVVARFQYALPALAGQLSADDLNKVDAVFSKARRWQLTLHTPNSADLITQCDKHLFQAALILPTVCIACCPKETYVWTQFEQERS